MKKINILKDYIDKSIKENSGIELINENKELRVKGNKNDLLELADYIIDVALSENRKDHLHIDENILISENSPIKELIIEKE